MTTNANLHRAKKEKNDEFYTRYEDIEKELVHYIPHFKDKVVYCNCDSEQSNFYKFFKDHFEEYGLKRLICTHYNPNGSSYAIVIDRDDMEPLEGFGEPIYIDCEGARYREYRLALDSGDFRSEQCIRILDMSDIVCTNPPFSMFREFVRMILAHGKKFLILGHISALSCQGIARTIMGGGLWLGISIKGGDRMFEVPREYWSFDKKPKEIDGKLYHTVNGIRWYTNIDHEGRHRPLDTGCSFDPDIYPKYDRFDAIEVGSYTRIPMDYDGIMGVPMSFMNYWCPEQFEIIGTSQLPPRGRGYATVINGKKVYERLLIRRKNP